MSTQIKRLYQNNTEFVPITLAEAVVVQTSNIEALSSIGITTLDKVLRLTLGIVSDNTSGITNLNSAVTEINSKLSNKQDKLQAGNGIDITDGVISVTHTAELYKIVTQLPMPSEECTNSIYLLPSGGTTAGVYVEYICIQMSDGQYRWEELGQISTDVDLSGYVTTETFNATINNIENEISTISSTVSTLQASMITAQSVTLSDNITTVVVSYDIPANLYDSLISS